MPFSLPLFFFTSALAVQTCLDNTLWRDSYGWTCRDYDRVPQECNSVLAVSVAGITVSEACCACESHVERRRDFSSCITTCSAEDDACSSECTADKAACINDCTDDWADDDEDETGGVVPAEAPTEGSSSSSSSMEPWMIILIILGVLLVLCITCLIIFFLCMPESEASCQDAEFSQQPMLVEGTCDTSCGDMTQNSCAGTQGLTYAPVQQDMQGYASGQQFPQRW